jgi:hypothetical protein
LELHGARIGDDPQAGKSFPTAGLRIVGVTDAAG